MEVSLKVSKPKGGTKTYRVSKPEIVVGRGKDCDMQILSTEVSRQHCRFTISDETVTVQDLGSANGTSVNGIPIKANKDIPLLPDALIEIGPLKILVEFARADDVFDGTSTVPSTQDGTVIGEDVDADEKATADEIPELPIEATQPAPVTPLDEETLEEITPVRATVPVRDVDDIGSQTLELDSLEELEGDVQFDMTAVPAGLPDTFGGGEELMEMEPLDDADVETVDTVATGPAAVAPLATPEPVESKQKPGGLKSLFGLIGRGKKGEDDQAAAEPEPAAPVEEIAPVPVVPAPVAPVAEVPAAAAAEAVDELEGLDDAEIDGLLEELEDEYDDDELQALLAEDEAETTDAAANPAPPPPADPGLNDFLNQIGQGGG